MPDMEGDQCEDLEDIENIEHLDEVEELQPHVADVGKICKNERVTSRQSTGSTMLPGETTRQSTTSLVMPCVFNVMPNGMGDSRPEQATTEQTSARPQRASLAKERASLKLPGVTIDESQRFGKRDSVSKDDKNKAGDAVQRSPSQNARRSFLTQDDIQQLQQLAAKQDKEWTWTRSSTGHWGFNFGEVRQRRLMLWLFLEEPWETLKSALFSSVMVIIILASIFHSIYSHKKRGSSYIESSSDDVDSWDVAFNTIFILDTTVRWWCHPLPLRFPLAPKNLIDIFSLVPFIINSVLRLPQVTGFSFLRWLRPYESFLRLLKLSRYFWGWQLLFHAMLDSLKALVIPLLFLVLIVTFGSCTVYIFEALHDEAVGTVSDDTDLLTRLEFRWVTIRSLPDAIHFSIICVLSLSTGPFYNMEAVAVPSQITVVLLMLFGMLFMAMPIAIVGSCFSQTWFDQDRIVLLNKVRSRLTAQGYTPQDLQDVFDEVDEDASGFIEFQEFRKMIKTFHLRSFNSAKCRNLFSYFDTDSDGVISFSDFALTLYPDLSLADDEEEDSDSESDNEVNKKSSMLSFMSTSTSRASCESAGGLRPAPPIGSPATMSVENSLKTPGRRKSLGGDAVNRLEVQPAARTSDQSEGKSDGRPGVGSVQSEDSNLYPVTSVNTKNTSRSVDTKVTAVSEAAFSARDSSSSAFGPKGSNTSAFEPKGSLSKWLQDKWSSPTKKTAGQRKADKAAAIAARQKASASKVPSQSPENDVAETLPGQIDYEVALQKLEELKQKKPSLHRGQSEELHDCNELNVVNLDHASVHDIVDLRKRLSETDHAHQFDIPVRSMISDCSTWSAQPDGFHMTVPSGSIQAAVAHLEKAIHALEKRMERRIDQLISLCVNNANGRAASAALPFAPPLHGTQTPGGFRAPRSHAQMAHDHRSLPSSRLGSRKPSMITDSIAVQHLQHPPTSVAHSRRTSIGGVSQITGGVSHVGSRRTSIGGASQMTAAQITGARRTSTGGMSQITGSRRTSLGTSDPRALGSDALVTDMSRPRRLSARMGGYGDSRRTSLTGNLHQASTGAQLQLNSENSKRRKSFAGLGHHE